MPSEMSPRGSSPSYFPDERQAGSWKMNDVAGYYGLKTDGTVRTAGIASPAHENRLPPDFQMDKGFDLPNYYLSRGRNVNLSSGKHLVGAEAAPSRSLPSAVDHHLGARLNLNMEPASYCLDGDKINLIGAQHENSLFSSSLSDLFIQKLKLPANDEVYGHSVGAAPSLYEEEEAFESLKELEAQTIGNLLPDDDDLLSGVTDGFHGSVRTNNAEDVEDLDLFSSVGGLELGEDGSSQINSDHSDVNFNNEVGIHGNPNVGHPSREIPSRTLFVGTINSNIEDSEIRTIFEQYGDIRTLNTSSKHHGFVMVSYYDLRAACNAMKDLQNKLLLHRKLDIHFSLPKDNSSENEINQGSLVVFNLDSSVSNNQLLEIFGAYGEIKEIRETPYRSYSKFVEFYDVRAAESTLRSLNWSEIAGKQIKLELGPPGGSKSLMQTLSSELEQEESGLRMQRGSPSNRPTGFSGSLSLGSNLNPDNGTVIGPLSTNGGSIGSLLDNMLHASSVPNSLSSLSRVESATIAESSHLRNQLNFDLQGTANFHPRSFPEFHDGLANGVFGSPRTMAANISARAPEIINNQQFRRVSSNGQSIDYNEVFGSSGNGSCPPGRHYLWNNNPNHPQAQSTMWPNSPTFLNGITAAHSQQQLHAIPRAPSHMLNSLHPLNNHHVGSAPSINHSLWDRRQTYAGESPDATMFHPGSLSNMGISGTSPHPHPLEFVHHGIFPQTAGNGMDITRNIGLHPHHQRLMVFPNRGQMMPMMSSFDSPNERTRSRRNEGGTSQSDNKKQFELDLDRILQGEDKRTTLMIKNIPNKYTSKMLLAAIDERHKGTYDFIYLPIDFKNKCNVGYAFINMTEPKQIVPFYQTINGKKWEKFNSEKVATLAYARIQGKAALIAHFQNSSLMNEDKRCRPILFHTDGPNAGDQVPFPMGSNIRSRSGKVHASTSEENNQQLPSNSINEDYSNGDLSSGSGKDSD